METDKLGFFYMSTTQKNYELKRVFFKSRYRQQFKIWMFLLELCTKFKILASEISKIIQ